MIPERHMMSRESALALLARADVVHVAGGEGRIILRALHAVLIDEVLIWHCSLRGEKDAMLGQVAEVSAHEKVAEIPSHFRDPENACPATTYYESVLAGGMPEPVTDPADKVRLLQAIMEKYQPEGGYRPLSIDDGDYERALAGVKLVRMPLQQISGKSKLGQNLSSEQFSMILEGLWRRGRSADLAAIDRLATANPARELPTILTAPKGYRLLCAPGPERLPEVADLLANRYWTKNESARDLREAHRLGAWMALIETGSGKLAASGRLLGDGLRRTSLQDMIVQDDLRGKGLGSALLKAMLDHPLARRVRRIELRTSDAHDFYRRFGFELSAGRRDGATMELSPGPGGEDPH